MAVNDSSRVVKYLAPRGTVHINVWRFLMTHLSVDLKTELVRPLAPGSAKWTAERELTRTRAATVFPATRRNWITSVATSSSMDPLDVAASSSRKVVPLPNGRFAFVFLENGPIEADWTPLASWAKLVHFDATLALQASGQAKSN